MKIKFKKIKLLFALSLIITYTSGAETYCKEISHYFYLRICFNFTHPDDGLHVLFSIHGIPNQQTRSLY